jgi:biopolymer transport protein TolQ
MSAPVQAPAAADATVQLDPLSLLLNASGPVLAVNCVLVTMAGLVWVVAVLKLLQVSRLAQAELAFEEAAHKALTPSDLFGVAVAHKEAPGARVVAEIARRGGSAKLAAATAKRALVEEAQRAGSLVGILGSVGSAGPFIGLFGTVWGIMDAFLRIGREKSASLPVVAPAIGEALIATAVGLFAAIPAVLFFNAVSRRIDDLVQSLEAASEAWVVILTSDEPARPASQPSQPPGRPPERSERPESQAPHTPLPYPSLPPAPGVPRL